MVARSNKNFGYKSILNNHTTWKHFFAYSIVILLILTSFSGFLIILNSNALIANAKIELKPIKDEKIDGRDIIDIERIKIKKPICCFPAGTKITMQDGALKNIENIESGDIVLAYNTNKEIFTNAKVNNLILVVREGIYEINDGLISPTNDHPLYVQKPNGRMKWAAIDPKIAKRAHKLKSVSPLEIGDKLFTSDESLVEINSITYIEGFIQTYTLDVRSPGNCFANSILAHAKVKCRSTPSPLPLITGFSPSSRNWGNSEISVIVSCSDNLGLRSYAYEWSTSSDTPSVYDDGFGLISGIVDDFTATKASGDSEWYLHVKIWDISSFSNTGYSGLYKLDTIGPNVLCDPSSEGLDESFVNDEAVVEISLIDGMSGPDLYRYSWSDSTNKPSNGWTDWLSYDVSDSVIKSDHGVYYLHVEGRDIAGNLQYTYFGPYQINRAPVADFIISNQTINSFNNVIFNSTSFDDDGIVSYSWDLNDDGTVDFSGPDIEYMFNLSYNYTVRLIVVDADGAQTNITNYLDVHEINEFYSGKNFYTWRKNEEITASEFADMLNLEENETIMLYNFSEDVCDWDEIFIVNIPSDDFMIKKHDVIKIHLKEDRYIYHDFGSWDSLNIYVNRVFKFVGGSSTNNGYNVAPWTKEHKIRASSLAEEINLPDFCTLSVFDKQTDSYKTYFKLPGNPTAGHPDLDPWIKSGDIFLVKLSNGSVLNYDTTQIDDDYYTLAENIPN